MAADFLQKQPARGSGTPLAGGIVTPGEAATIAAVVGTFVRAIETSDFDGRLQLAEAGCANDPAAAAGVYRADADRRFNP